MVLLMLLWGCGASEPVPVVAECPTVDATRMGALAFSLARCRILEQPVDFYPPASLWATCADVYAEACTSPEGIRQAAAAGASPLLPCAATIDKAATFGDSTR